MARQEKQSALQIMPQGGVGEEWVVPDIPATKKGTKSTPGEERLLRQSRQFLHRVRTKAGDSACNMVEAVYKHANGALQKEAFNTLVDGLAERGWEVVADSLTSEDPVQTQGGFKAIAFVHHKTRRVEIAVAGTRPTEMDDLVDDVRLAVGDYNFAKKEAMAAFLKSTVAKLGGVAQEYHFRTSGHSLGAVIADCLGVMLVAQGYDFCGSTTFDSPGSESAVQYHIEALQLTPEQQKKIEALRDRCRIFNAAPNFINTLDKPFGNVLYEVLPQKDASSVEQIAADSKHLWGSYLYSAVSQVAQGIGGHFTQCLFNGLGIGTLLEQIKQHKLPNFKALEKNKVVVRVDKSSWGSGVRILDLPQNDPIVTSLRSASSTAYQQGSAYKVLLAVDEQGVAHYEHYSRADVEAAYNAVNRRQEVASKTTQCILQAIAAEGMGSSLLEVHGPRGGCSEQQTFVSLPYQRVRSQG